MKSMTYKRGDEVRINHRTTRRDATGVVTATGWDGTYTISVEGRVRREQISRRSAPFTAQPTKKARPAQAEAAPGLSAARWL